MQFNEHEILEIKNMSFKSFVLNDIMKNACNGIFFDKEDDDGTWIEIVASYNTSDIIVNYIHNSETIRIITTKDFDMLQETIENYIPDEMRG